MDDVSLFVFGAGFAASAAIDALRSARPGARVSATTRDAGKLRLLASRGIHAHLFDGETPGATLLPDLERATHLLVSIGPDAKGDPALREHASHIEAARRLEWIGYYSTIGVYGDSGGDWIDETAPTPATNPRIARRLEAETLWSELANTKNIPLAIMRLAGIYGPGRSAFDKLRAGTAHRINKPGQVFNRIHTTDIGEMTARAALRQLGGVYNLTDDDPAPPQDVVAYAADLLGIDPPPEIPFETAQMSDMARSFYANTKRVSGGKIRKALGYELAYPDYRAGLEAILKTEGVRVPAND
ncbi:NAD(P)-dependent oxidoreductase [Pelagibacterium xiamenense]|uniref:NAD(P)-dependent oxidoreductase n=1 Tax=Pelagibacterium xiamenense TaxID=2901140 RepID=UPI001E40A221|nr:NAD(P)-dependent oxidoreductase [Pelagibacterium xiamenense]MCD7058548.1 NAD(P)-dependent oxidoreductase [Pelagibacterium xiamenense]